MRRGHNGHSTRRRSAHHTSDVCNPQNDTRDMPTQLPPSQSRSQSVMRPAPQRAHDGSAGRKPVLATSWRGFAENPHNGASCGHGCRQIQHLRLCGQGFADSRQLGRVGAYVAASEDGVVIEHLACRVNRGCPVEQGAENAISEMVPRRRHRHFEEGHNTLRDEWRRLGLAQE